MLVALAASLSLTVLWLALVALGDTLDSNRDKVLAALRGHSLIASERTIAEVRVRVSQPYSVTRRAVTAMPELRAAA